MGPVLVVDDDDIQQMLSHNIPTIHHVTINTVPKHNSNAIW